MVYTLLCLQSCAACTQDTGEVCDARGSLLGTRGSAIFHPTAGKALTRVPALQQPSCTWDRFALASGVALPGEELAG